MNKDHAEKQFTPGTHPEEIALIESFNLALEEFKVAAAKHQEIEAKRVQFANLTNEAEATGKEISLKVRDNIRGSGDNIKVIAQLRGEMREQFTLAEMYKETERECAAEASVVKIAAGDVVSRISALRMRILTLAASNALNAALDNLGSLFVAIRLTEKSIDGKLDPRVTADVTIADAGDLAIKDALSQVRRRYLGSVDQSDREILGHLPALFENHGLYEYPPMSPATKHVLAKSMGATS